MILALIAPVLAAETWGPYRAEYVDNYDGDTVTLRLDVYPGWYKRASIRLRGVDTPEIRGDCEAERARAVEARDRVRTLLRRVAEIEVTIHDIGKYGRPIADVVADGDDLADLLIRSGLGRRYNGGSRETWCG